MRGVNLREEILHVRIIIGSDLQYSNILCHQTTGVLLVAKKSSAKSAQRTQFLTTNQIV